MHETEYRQLKFLGEWCMPAEGVKLSGARKRVWTRNGCSSGEAHYEYRRCKVVSNRISQVKGQRIHFAKVRLFVLDFFFGAVDKTAPFLFVKKRGVFHQGMWDTEKRLLCKH